MNWAAYPEHRCNAPPDAFDRSFYRKRLLEDAARLFKPGESEVKLVYVAKQPHAISARMVTDLASLGEALAPLEQEQAHGLSSVFVFIKQRHSWDHLKISLELMQRLLAFFDVSPLFLDYLHGFGSRSDNIGDEYVSHRSVESMCGDEGLRTESCYNLRFPEKNDRQTRNPWSMRHSALYMQRDPQKDLDIWILIQPSTSFECQATRLISSPHCRNTLIHSAFFYSTGRFWRDYINDLQKELLPTEHKAFYSRVGVAGNHDFSLAFKDYQLLQQLNQELLRAQYIIDGSVDAAACRKELAAQQPGWTNDNMFTDYIAQTQEQRRLQQILTYRNDETSQRIDGGIVRQATALHDLARAAARDSEALASLGRRAQRDSRTVKVLTIVAAMYLPAALVATVFSSNLVQSVSLGEGAATAEHFQLASQFWQFPVATLLLTVLTLGPVLAWTHFHNDEVVAAKVAP
ncbi:hypothetical protein BGZ61DRAFT_531383 [Ilyonectria robusta]|uniref:uncharacterized protein n=1 Tax=Ilyonectria robusta TaxID=1079257 RepID=UPI001E8D384A|nr:uncharacterized protein BGZ61DRAFT_531383 [Ilyonectria robusta]KAH8706165.1 hypothetical protein BGZ61DRAFT_531383 [Ilyonectria robusta]